MDRTEDLLVATFKLAAAVSVGPGASFGTLSRAMGRQNNRIAHLARAQEALAELPARSSVEAWARKRQSQRLEAVGNRLQQRVSALRAARDQV